MPDNEAESIQIRISRIVPAPKWKIIRLITKVSEFPAYVPCVKEASVIQKSQNKMKTRWRIEVDRIPISWTEEDTLALRQNAISFKAIEGDLQEFGGEWKFNDHPDGTEVTVSVFLKVGVPGIKDFADAYVKKLLTRNFEAIIDAVEKRIISTRYAGYKNGDSGKIGGFAIVGHLYNFAHFEKCLKMLNPDYKIPSQEFLGQLFNVTPSFKLCDIPNFKSRTGQTVNGCFIVATFIPEMIEKDIWAIFSKVVKACKIAEKSGVGIVTLGGFTSIVGERIGQEISSQVDVPVTTGNTFTAAMAIDGVLKAARVLNLDVSALKLTIIGGTGDIGSACARVLVDRVKQLVITGRTKANLKRLGAELAKRRKARVFATADNEAAVKDADIIISAAAATSPIIEIGWLKPGAVVCDVGYPKNISHASTGRRDILIFSGGLAKSPTPVSFPIDVGLPSPDIIYGCFAEAIILALEKRYENYSFGRGNITVEKIDEIRELGRKHGFEVASFYWGDRLIEDSFFSRGLEEAVR